MGMGYIGGSTKCEIRLFPSETWASGNQRTVKITFDAKVKGGSDSFFGYAVDYRVLVNGEASGWNRLKGAETWRGNNERRSFTQSLTVNVGTSNSTSIVVGVELKCRDASWNGSYTENFTVSQTNIAPTQPGWIQVKNGGSGGAVLSGIISENITNFYIDWGASSDANGDTITYILQEERNENGSWSTIDTGTDTAHQFNTVGGEGTTYKYSVVARDGRGGESAWRTSGAITKNTFTMATLACGSTVSYQGGPLYFTFTGGSNTQPGVGITYNLTCSDIPIYNANNITSGKNVFINWGQGGGITNGPYINWDDVKNLFSKPQFQGRGSLTFVLEGVNSNGTRKTSRVSVPVNIQHEPGAFNSYISTDSRESTAYRQVADTKNWYFIPDGGNTVMVKWASASGSMGEEVKYRVYVAYGAGAWEELTTTKSTSFSHMIPRQVVSTQVKYKIRAMSIFNEGQYTESQTPAQTLHYYNTPTLTLDGIVRNINTATVSVVIKSNSSIPNINTVGTWSCNKQSGKLSPAQTAQAIKITGLTENDTYKLSITYKDSTGFSSDRTETLNVGAAVPIFYVNQYGVGVGGNKADEHTALTVKGKTFLEGGAKISGGLILGDVEQSNFVAGNNTTGTNNAQNANNIWRSGFYDYDRGANYPTSNTWYLLSNVAHTNNTKSTRYNLQTAAPIGGGNRFFMRNTNEQGAASWQELYHTGRKPSADDVGALPKGTRARDIGALPSNTTAADLGALEVRNSIRYGWFGQNAGQVEDGHNFDGYLTEGEYSIACHYGRASNSPVSGGLYGKLIVKVNDGGTKHSGNWIWQIVLSANGDRDEIFVRRKINQFPWGSWRRVSLISNYSLNDVDTLNVIDEQDNEITKLKQEVAELKEAVKMLMEGNTLN